MPGLGTGDTEGDHSVPALAWRQADPDRAGSSMLRQKDTLRDAGARGRAPKSENMYPGILQSWFFSLSSSRKASNNLWGLPSGLRIARGILSLPGPKPQIH